MAKRPRISELRHRVVLCSAHDVISENGTMVLTRKDALHTWAKIEAKQSSMFSPGGYALPFVEVGSELAKRGRQTHVVTTRMRREIDISSAAWIFEQRAQSGARWYKVLGIRELDDNGDFWVMSCRLIERGDELVAPVTPDDECEPAQVIKRHESGVKL